MTERRADARAKPEMRAARDDGDFHSDAEDVRIRRRRRRRRKAPIRVQIIIVLKLVEAFVIWINNCKRARNIVVGSGLKL